MKYMNAQQILPEKLLVEIQKYVQGEILYIPKLEQHYKGWGAVSGNRQRIDARNAAIRTAFKDGMSIQQLADYYYLSVETIKKIVYAKKK